MENQYYTIIEKQYFYKIIEDQYGKLDVFVDTHASAKSLAGTILGIQKLGVDNTKKALKEAYAIVHEQPSDTEDLKRYRDARKKWIKRRIQTAERVLESDKQVFEILTSERTPEACFNDLINYLIKNPARLKQNSDIKRR